MYKITLMKKMTWGRQGGFFLLIIRQINIHFHVIFLSLMGLTSHGSWEWDSLLVECRTLDQHDANLNLGRSGGRIFFSRVNFVCLLLFFVCFTPMFPQLHVKGPGHSAKSAESVCNIVSNYDYDYYLSVVLTN